MSNLQTVPVGIGGLCFKCACGKVKVMATRASQREGSRCCLAYRGIEHVMANLRAGRKISSGRPVCCFLWTLSADCWRLVRDARAAGVAEQSDSLSKTHLSAHLTRRNRSPSQRLKQRNYWMQRRTKKRTKMQTHGVLACAARIRRARGSSGCIAPDRNQRSRYRWCEDLQPRELRWIPVFVAEMFVRAAKLCQYKLSSGFKAKLTSHTFFRR
jgi:hypothetical protein